MSGASLRLRYVAPAAMHVGLLLASCAEQQMSASLRLKTNIGTENFYVTKFDGDIQRWREDSLTIKRQVGMDIYTTESYQSPDADTMVRMVTQDSTLSRIVEEKAGKKMDSIWVGPKFVSTFSHRGRLVNLEYLADSADMNLDYNRAFLEQTFPVFPEEPVNVGRQWTQTTKVIQNGNPLQASITFIVNGFETMDQRPVCAIGYDGIAIIPYPGRPGDTTFISAFNRLKVSGTIWFDYERGALHKQSEQRLITGERLATEHPGDTTTYRVQATYKLETRLLETRPIATASR